MNYIKGYAYKKNNFSFIKAIAIILIFVVGYEMIFVNKSKIDSETLNDNINIEDIIENSRNNVVGISIIDEFSQSKLVWGSGVIISKKGYIVTNEHIVNGANGNCYVVYDYDKKLKAKVIWTNSKIDLAILKVNYNFEKCAEIGEYEEIKVGQDIFSIGNPISSSFEKSVTKGIISGINRNLEFEENEQKIYLNNLIQTDATINPGSSGGALINSDGKLIGINTVKISSAESMNFAIPSEILKPIISKLENTGDFEEASIGIWGYDKYSINEFNSNLKIDTGVYVAQINGNSEAEKGGVRIGDIIIGVNNEEISTLLELQKIIFEKSPGEQIALKIRRNKKEVILNIKLIAI